MTVFTRNIVNPTKTIDLQDFRRKERDFVKTRKHLKIKEYGRKDEISNRILIKVTEWRNILFTVFFNK